jgi:hypothetical protein
MITESRIGNQVPEHRTTAWHNPTSKPQRVKLATDGEGRSRQEFFFTVGPGETKELDSKYDRAIHMVDCQREECYRRGRFCTQGHEGQIQGGLAPLLQRVGKKDELDPSLDPVIAEKAMLEDELTRSALVGQAKQSAAIAAAGRIQELETSQSATARGVPPKK